MSEMRWPWSKPAAERLATCQCGTTLSEWFVMYDSRTHRTVMYHCGTPSPWKTHQEFLNTTPPRRLGTSECSSRINVSRSEMSNTDDLAPPHAARTEGDQSADLCDGRLEAIRRLQRKARHSDPAAALFMFVAWLTTREEEVTFSDHHDASIAAQLVGQFCKWNRLPPAEMSQTPYTHPKAPDEVTTPRAPRAEGEDDG